MTQAVKDTMNKGVEAMFKVGAHFGLGRARRHPSTAEYIFGAKNKVEIFDLEKTSVLLDKAKEFVKTVAASGGMVLFAGSKNESLTAIKDAAMRLDQPYVAGRWIGGTLTNFPQIRKRVERMEDLISKREKGELAKYTKKERLLIDREIAKLERFFLGLVVMKQKPKAVFVIDPKKEMIAVREAKHENIPVIALAGSDCDISLVDYPIVGNDTARASIAFFVKEIADAYEAGRLSKKE
ncbi:MAG: 30S ribosomal protein S2 [Candidatus Paceibacterota bacterium]|jgi:small subunit ribosomal protein S2